MRRTVSVWLLTTSQPAAVLDQLAGLLDQSELARAAVMTEPEVHTEFVVSHAAARLILAELLGVPPGSLRWRHGRSGKPQLAEPVTDLQMSMSHSDGLAALAACTGYPVGIDVQRRRSATGLIRMAERYFPPAEAGFVAEAAGCPDELGRRFSMLWTRKEACAKVGGGRLIPALAWPSDHPDDPDSTDPLGPFRSGDPVAGTPVLIRDLVMPDGFHGAVAMAGRSDFEVIMHWWEPEALRYGRPAAIRTESSFDQIGVPMAVPGC
jgi:4'-phosphopantetheinyl transferase